MGVGVGVSVAVGVGLDVGVAVGPKKGISLAREQESAKAPSSRLSRMTLIFMKATIPEGFSDVNIRLEDDQDVSVLMGAENSESF